MRAAAWPRGDSRFTARSSVAADRGAGVLCLHRFRAHQAPPPPQSDRREHILKLSRATAWGAAFPPHSKVRSVPMTVVVLIACNLLLAGLFSLVAVALD